RLLQSQAIEPARDLGTERRQGIDDAVERFAVAPIRHAFAAAAMLAVGQFGDHHDGFSLGTAADRESAGDRPALDAHGQGRGTHNISLGYRTSERELAQWLARGRCGAAAV